MRTGPFSVCLLVITSLLCATAFGNEIHLTDEDNGESVEMTVGEFLSITLEGNPTTGYKWQVAEYEDAVLEQQGEGTYTPAGKALGGGGSYLFRFEAVGKGETTLRLIYFRPFESKPPIKTFEVTITVE